MSYAIGYFTLAAISCFLLGLWATRASLRSHSMLAAVLWAVLGIAYYVLTIVSVMVIARAT